MENSNPNQELFELSNPAKSFYPFGEELEVKARALSIDDLNELQEMFPDHNAYDANDLLNAGKDVSIKAYVAIVWLGVRKDTPRLKELASVRATLNAQTVRKWQPAVSYIAGIEFVDADNTDEPPPKAEDEAVDPKNG